MKTSKDIGILKKRVEILNELNNMLDRLDTMCSSVRYYEDSQVSYMSAELDKLLIVMQGTITNLH